MDHPVSGVVSTDITNGNVIAWGGTTANGKPFANLTAVADVSFAFGVSGDSPSDGNITTSFSEFSNDEKHDISLILAGAASTTVINSLVSLAETRRDCVVFASPLMSDVVNTTGQAAKVVVTRNALTSSSYGFMDSSWKYQYDRYNDKYRWVPMNGDVAGLAARTDYTNDPWFSPAGFNRGTIKNVVKLSYSPSKTDRDTLYKNGINPVVSFPGQGTVLFGDKTMLSKPSAFDRINVRRLFIVLEKAIATAAKFQLFEFNDGFTRAQFKNLVEPFLRDVQGRRGITDFRVVCDETNNTGEVIDRNEFVADIFIKPARSINFIQLNFIATRTGISFEETGA
jgi:phage tail sheath protein FI